MSRTGRYLLSLAGAGVGVLVAGLAYVYWQGEQPVNRPADLFIIEPGVGSAAVARKLTGEDIIDEPYSLIIWAYYKGYTSSLRAGEYRIEAGTTLRDLLEKFVSGDVIKYQLTLVEGWTFRQFLDLLREAPKLRHTLDYTQPAAVMTGLGYGRQHPEGRFFPDTYVYTAGTADTRILRQARERMDRVLAEEWAQRPADSLLATAYEALILASIVEKETALPAERGLVSAVFHNRIKQRMRLQTDPTVIYGIGADFDGNLTRRHLRTDTPYNTYTRAGLPPTPIAMPGRGSIRAAIHPADTTALYFVSRGDGSHQFSETLAEHNRAVAKYQLSRRERKSR